MSMLETAGQVLLRTGFWVVRSSSFRGGSNAAWPNLGVLASGSCVIYTQLNISPASYALITEGVSAGNI